MNAKSNKNGLIRVFMIILFLQILFNLIVSCDIQFLRQFFGFIYLTSLPGIILLKILKMDKDQSKLETLLFSAGLSIALLMILGLSINEFGTLLNFNGPLALIPLLMIINLFMLVGVILIYLRNADVDFIKQKKLALHFSILLFSSLPILSIIGAIYMHMFQNNGILLFMLLLISLLFGITVLFEKFLPSTLYPFAIMMIGMALLLHSTLTSKYIIPFGSDIPGEYYLFRTVESNAYWSLSLPYSLDIWYGRLNAMLSVTIFPTFYTNILNIAPTWVFKIVYPLIFSFIPLGLYQIWQITIGKKYAFISSFLFMAQQTFYIEMLGLSRQMIAELFFVLLLLVIMNKNMKTINRAISFAIFSFALITSHYALAVIFLFFISSIFILLTILKRLSKNITIYTVVFFFVMMFAWYIYTSGSATFSSILEFGDHVYRQLGDFFNPASRGQTVLTGLGLSEPPSIWNTISRMFAYITQALIVFGFIGLVTRRVNTRVGNEFFISSLIAMSFLAALIIVPGLANTLRMSRFYHILLFFLAPLCVIGAEFIVKLIFRQERKFAVFSLLLIVLIPYFLFQTEFMYEITGSDSWSISLSGYRMNALRLYGQYGYIDDCSSYGTQWLSKNANTNDTALYADERTLINVLTIQGMIRRGNPLTNTTRVEDNSIIYLSTLNVVHQAIPYEGFLWNTSELSYIFDDLNVVYANGGCGIYESSP